MTTVQYLDGHVPRRTRVLSVDASKVGQFVFEDPQQSFLGEWKLQLSSSSADATNLQEAASLLRNSDTPVAFPTETVYGLGADATRSSAVRGIYEVKQRPSDNPLIVHISSLSQIRKLLSTPVDSDLVIETNQDPIPSIYHPLIAKFWPGPLTVLLPLPMPSLVAAEVTNLLPTVAVRMPSSRLALALIQLAGTPLAAPSANASSRPSPTTAAHVVHDLSGRIDLILDGGPCDIGVESTVVDGLTDPPVVLRPGGVTTDMLRGIPGWENVRAAYKEGAELGVPRAPGMKYKHYSPNARVLLFHGAMNADVARQYLDGTKSMGLIMTESWGLEWLRGYSSVAEGVGIIHGTLEMSQANNEAEVNVTPLQDLGGDTDGSRDGSIPSARYFHLQLGDDSNQSIHVWTVALGPTTADVARGLFSALRELDRKAVDVIFVEGVEDREGGAGAAIMNRLRKAAELEIRL